MHIVLIPSPAQGHKVNFPYPKTREGVIWSFAEKDELRNQISNNFMLKN